MSKCSHCFCGKNFLETGPSCGPDLSRVVEDATGFRNLLTSCFFNILSIKGGIIAKLRWEEHKTLEPTTATTTTATRQTYYVQTKYWMFYVKY